MGKRKIEIAKIENRDKRMVTFSKRRKGLFGKADFLAKSYGAKIAILVFSPAGNPYTNSNFDEIFDAYIGDHSENFNKTYDEIESSIDWVNSINLDDYDSLEKLNVLQAKLESLRDKIKRSFPFDPLPVVSSTDLSVDDYSIDMTSSFEELFEVPSVPSLPNSLDYSHSLHQNIVGACLSESSGKNNYFLGFDDVNKSSFANESCSVTFGSDFSVYGDTEIITSQIDEFLLLPPHSSSSSSIYLNLLDGSSEISDSNQWFMGYEAGNMNLFTTNRCPGIAPGTDVSATAK